MSEFRCEECKYFAPEDEESVKGHCRKNAPPVLLGNPDGIVNTRAVWPRVYPKSDWCGEFTDKFRLN